MTGSFSLHKFMGSLFRHVGDCRTLLTRIGTVVSSWIENQERDHHLEFFHTGQEIQQMQPCPDQRCLAVYLKLVASLPQLPWTSKRSTCCFHRLWYYLLLLLLETILGVSSCQPQRSLGDQSREVLSCQRIQRNPLCNVVPRALTPMPGPVIKPPSQP